MKDWPPSNYPIFLALVLLAATAVTLAMGDEPRAEELAIYAYYLLVIGVTIRFFELALPDNTVQMLDAVRIRISAWLKQHASVLRRLHIRIPNIKMHVRIPYLNRDKLVMMADVSKNVAIFLSVFFIISLIYGLMIDMWIVRGYISKLVLIILGFLTLHFFTRGKGRYEAV